jgi:uncharacterized protein YjiS (DUF1127 family)
MSCGGRACTSINLIEITAGAPARRFWLSSCFIVLRAAFRTARRRQVWIGFEKVRQRRILLQLDDRLLRDIGLTREQAFREGQKRFWE